MCSNVPKGLKNLKLYFSYLAAVCKRARLSCVDHCSNGRSAAGHDHNMELSFQSSPHFLLFCIVWLLVSMNTWVSGTNTAVGQPCLYTCKYRQNSSRQRTDFYECLHWKSFRQDGTLQVVKHCSTLMKMYIALIFNVLCRSVLHQILVTYLAEALNDGSTGKK